MITIDKVLPGSPAARSGIRAGDTLVAIDGRQPRDVIDYQLLADEARLVLDVSANGSLRQVAVEKSEGEPLGLGFDRSIFDRVKICRNRCVFCFIDQLPRGMRTSLYLKDDDYRLSFLHGNFITLTNLEEGEVDRVIEQRLSPLYVSVHTTNPDVRRELMGNPLAGESLGILRELTAAGIEVHVQIVLCPGWNDGRELARTLRDLEETYGPVASVGVVPVGLTSHLNAPDSGAAEKKNGPRRGSAVPELRPVGAREAAETIRLARRIQARRRAKTGTGWLYLADEFYLAAGEPIPPAQHYDDFPQLENGIGLTALFLRDAERRLREAAPAPRPYEVTIVTGRLAAPILRRVGGKMDRKLGIGADVVVAEHIFFGGNVGVAPLLAGADLCAALRDREGLVWVPDRMLNADGLLLDGMTLEEVESGLKCRLVAAPTEGDRLVAFAQECGAP